jgi:hypothetical protein
MTGTRAETNARTAANFAFGALLFALFGWMNLEVLLLANSRNAGGHVLACALGLCLTIAAYRRYRSCWVPLARSRRQFARQGASRACRIGSGFALAVAGFALASSMRTGFATGAVIGAGILTLIPWSRNSFCRKYFFVSHTLLVAGGLPMLIMAAKDQDPFILLAVSGILWALASSLLLSTLWSQSPR